MLVQFNDGVTRDVKATYGNREVVDQDEFIKVFSKTQDYLGRADDGALRLNKDLPENVGKTIEIHVSCI